MKILCRMLFIACQCLWVSGSRAQDPSITPAQTRMSLSFPMTVTPAEGQPARTVQCSLAYGPPAMVGAVAFSPDGTALAAGGYQEVLLWDLAGAKLARRIGVGQLSGAVHALAFSPNGQLLAIPDGTPHGPCAVKLFDVASGEVMATWEEPKEVIYCLTFSPDGKLLVGGSVDSSVYVWSVDEKKLATALSGHSGWVLCATFSRDGKLLATGGSDKTLQVWDTATWKQDKSWNELESVRGAAFSPDGQYVAVAVCGPTDRAVRLRRRTDAWQPRAVGLGVLRPLDVIWVHKTNRLYIPSSENTVRVYDAGNARSLATLAGHTDWVHSVAVTADGTKVASGSADGTVKLWSTADNRLLATLIQLAPRTDQWLIVAQPGYLASSALNELQWQTGNVQTPPNQIVGSLQNPEMVAKAIAGEQITPATLQ